MLNFGVVQTPTLISDRQIAVQSGARIDIGHSFATTSDMDIDFAIASVVESSPGISTITLWRDLDCDFDITFGDTGINDPVAAVADEQICIIASVQTSSAAPAGSAVSFDLTATASYTGTPVSAFVLNTDLVTIDSANAVDLEKRVCNATQGACNFATASTPVGYQGGLEWHCSGSLLPQEVGAVFFEVSIDQ